MSVDLHILTYFWRAWHSEDVGKQTGNVSRVGFRKNQSNSRKENNFNWVHFSGETSRQIHSRWTKQTWRKGNFFATFFVVKLTGQESLEICSFRFHFDLNENFWGKSQQGKDSFEVVRFLWVSLFGFFLVFGVLKKKLDS